MDTSTLDLHQKYTRDEYIDNKYYSFVLNTLKKAKIKSMIDAGACTGEVTKIMQENIPSLKECYLIEPITKNVEYVKKNVRGEVLHRALYYGKDELMIGGFSHNVGSGSAFWGENGEMVETITLEDLPIVDFLKMDIEGLEANIIKNSTNIQKIKFLEIEFHHFDELLQYAENRLPFLSEWLPNHKIVLNGADSDKESSIFLSL